MRPRQVLIDVGKAYPNAWRDVRRFREGKGIDLPNWADWCFLPIAAGIAIASGGINDKIIATSMSNITNPATITAAATWRISQGVYRFDYDLYESLTTQPMDDKLPCDALKRLPEYCVYIETYNATWTDMPIDGFFSHLEQDMNDFREELRFVFLLQDGRNVPFAIHIGNWTLAEGIRKMQEESNRQTIRHLNFQIPQPPHDYMGDIVPYLQLVLYLCAENMDILKSPVHPKTRASRKNVIEPVKTFRMWHVGQRIGATIRKHRNVEAVEDSQGVTLGEDSGELAQRRPSPRPHIRKAHWHSFWKGPRDGERELIVHWIPPIPVGVNMDDDSPIVIHPVK